MRSGICLAREGRKERIFSELGGPGLGSIPCCALITYGS